MEAIRSIGWGERPCARVSFRSFLESMRLRCCGSAHAMTRSVVRSRSLVQTPGGVGQHSGCPAVLGGVRRENGWGYWTRRGLLSPKQMRNGARRSRRNSTLCCAGMPQKPLGHVRCCRSIAPGAFCARGADRRCSWPTENSRAALGGRASMRHWTARSARQRIEATG